MKRKKKKKRRSRKRYIFFPFPPLSAGERREEKRGEGKSREKKRGPTRFIRSPPFCDLPQTHREKRETKGGGFRRKGGSTAFPFGTIGRWRPKKGGKKKKRIGGKRESIAFPFSTPPQRGGERKGIGERRRGNEQPL